MKDIPLNNEEFMDILSDATELILSDRIREAAREEQKKRKLDREWFVGEEYMHQIIRKERMHEGYPEASDGIPICPNQPKEKDNAAIIGNVGTELSSKALEIDKRIQSFIGTRNNALFMVYPPGGFIGWHNNANASGFNVLLTWSETGEGYWQHIDPDTKELITIPDVKGWQCKAGYYGRYDEANKVLYHCAATDCWRMTIAFVFNAEESGMQMAEMALEDISTSYK